MSREKIKEIARDLCECYNDDGTCYCDDKPCDLKCENFTDAQYIYAKGYRKQSEGEWIKDKESKFEHRYHCSVCNFYLIGEPTKYCEDCGAKMKGGAE